MKNSNRNVISKPVLQPIREPYLTTQSVLSVYLSICLSVYLSICLSVYLSICLSVYLSICLSVYQKHNYLALYCQLIDSLCYLFPVIFLFKKSAIFFGQSMFSRNTTGTSHFFRFCLSSHTLKRRSDMKPKRRAS